MMFDDEKRPGEEAPPDIEIISSGPDDEGYDGLDGYEDDDSGEGDYGQSDAARASSLERRTAAAAAAVKARKEREEREAMLDEQKKLGLLARIQKMDVGEKAKLARAGDKEVRSILIKDSNKQVSMAVIGNPRMTIQEVEIIAASRNVTEDILREVAKNKDWCKSYTVILSLVNNPKTPIPISLSFIPKLRTLDLRFIAKSKGVPEAVRNTAKRQVEKRSF